MVAESVVLAAALAWPPGCVDEGQTPFGAPLDALWLEAAAIAAGPGPGRGPAAGSAAPPRPRFCFTHRPMHRAGRRILAGLDARAGAAAVMLSPEELARLGRCVVVHEMLHALLGPGREAAVRARLACAAEGG